MVDGRYDVIVAGAGNAALCAAISARQNGASVIVLERAPPHLRGGNSAFSAGAMRVPLRGMEDLAALVPAMRDAAATFKIDPYTEAEFRDDILRLSGYASDPELVEVVVRNAYPTMRWMAGLGVRFESHLDRRGVTVGNVVLNPRDAFFRAAGRGKGLIDALWSSAEALGVEFRYETTVKSLVMDGSRVAGITVRSRRHEETLRADQVILACGGFEANPEMRARYLGPNWDLAKVRGTPYNTGEGLKMAMAIGALPYGHWSGAHALAQDINAPAVGDPETGELHAKDAYYFGIIVNRDGQRFVDEGANFRAYTYATQGAEIVKQPGSVAFQIFDQTVYPLLDEAYRLEKTTVVKAGTLEELANRLGIKAEPFLATVDAFNAAVREDVPIDYAVLDGRSAKGISPPKSNWARKLATPPFWGFPVTVGITFTYGGIRVNPEGQVLDEDLLPIAGLYAAGEMVGGIFHRNYPGSSGLVSGSVFGRISGQHAARNARANAP